MQVTQEQSGAVQFRNSPEIARVPGFSQAAVVSGGKTIFVSGQVGLNEAGEMVGNNDFQAQAAQVFANLEAVLVAAGAGRANIVKLGMYVVGLNKERLEILRSLRDAYVDKDHTPASTLVGVQALFREECLVEIEAVAVIP